MATEQAIEDRVLGIYQSNGELMAEEVFPIYEHLHGATARSNSIHTTISRLTKKGFLEVVRRQVSPLTGKTVNVWKEHTGTTPAPVFITEKKLSNNQLTGENTLLLARNKNLEETNMKLMNMIEKLREEVTGLKDKLEEAHYDALDAAERRDM